MTQFVKDDSPHIVPDHIGSDFDSLKEYYCKLYTTDVPTQEVSSKWKCEDGTITIKKGIVFTKERLEDSRLIKIAHRLNDLPAYIAEDAVVWFIEGNVHREADQPAVLHKSGTREWHVNGKCHRVNGPAIVHFNGDVEYWLDGIHLNEAQFFAKQVGL